jgi:hypothetical protein
MLSASLARRDHLTMLKLETAIAPGTLLSLTPRPESAPSVHMKSPFGTERPALLALPPPTTTSSQKPALSALRVSPTTLLREPVSSTAVHDST